MNNNIPILTPADVELRVQQILPGKDGQTPACIMLVYKDARVDMRILDQVYGPMNWQRQHEVVDGQLFCKVSIWDDAKGQWVTKSDVGTESKTEAEKGRSSDSFKRACFNWGIGRELYAAPFIYIPLNPGEAYERNGRYFLSGKAKFKVTEMVYDTERNEYTTFIVKDRNGNTRFSVGKPQTEPPPRANVGATGESNPAGGTNATPPAENTYTGQNNPEPHCCNCGAKITQKVFDYSMKNYKQPLCMDCQKKAPR